jgi:hypothetical protein
VSERIVEVAVTVTVETNKRTVRETFVLGDEESFSELFQRALDGARAVTE